MRDLNELYSLFYRYIQGRHYIEGLCAAMIGMREEDLVSRDEYFKLYDHFIFQKPSENKHEQFTKADTFNGNSYWWNIQEDYNPVNRIAFVKYLSEIQWKE